MSTRAEAVARKLLNALTNPWGKSNSRKRSKRRATTDCPDDANSELNRTNDRRRSCMGRMWILFFRERDWPQTPRTRRTFGRAKRDNCSQSSIVGEMHWE